MRSRLTPFVIAAILAAGAGPAIAADIVGVPRIVDGDTVEISGTKIRLEGIDAPETDQLCLDAKGARWACGTAARDALDRPAGGRPWTCTPKSQDRYGRTLSACGFAGEDVEKWMVRSGWALAFVRYSHAYDSDQVAAQSANAGLWAASFIAHGTGGPGTSRP